MLTFHIDPVARHFNGRFHQPKFVAHLDLLINFLYVLEFLQHWWLDCLSLEIPSGIQLLHLSTYNVSILVENETNLHSVFHYENILGFLY